MSEDDFEYMRRRRQQAQESAAKESRRASEQAERSLAEYEERLKPIETALSDTLETLSKWNAIESHEDAHSELSKKRAERESVQKKDLVRFNKGANIKEKISALVRKEEAFFMSIEDNSANIDGMIVERKILEIAKDRRSIKLKQELSFEKSWWSGGYKLRNAGSVQEVVEDLQNRWGCFVVWDKVRESYSIFTGSHGSPRDETQFVDLKYTDEVKKGVLDLLSDQIRDL